MYKHGFPDKGKSNHWQSYLKKGMLEISRSMSENTGIKSNICIIR